MLKVDWGEWEHALNVFIWQAICLTMKPPSTDYTRAGLREWPPQSIRSLGITELQVEYAPRMRKATHGFPGTAPVSLGSPYPGHPEWRVVSMPEFAKWVLVKGWAVPDDFPWLAKRATAKVAPTAIVGATWAVSKPQRDDGLATPIFRVLKAAHDCESPRPSAIDVLEAFRAALPTEIVRVLADGCDYFDRKGNEASADLNSIRKRIEHMTAAQAPPKTRKRRATRAGKTSQRI